ncbi:MAG: hypothetical protein ACI9S8_003305, partial [Chlamydiales bacterium]
FFLLFSNKLKTFFNSQNSTKQPHRYTSNLFKINLFPTHPIIVYRETKETTTRRV